MKISSFRNVQAFIQKHEWIVTLGLFIIFLAFTLPGISWGAPDVWNVDEIVVRSIKALHGEWKFSEINFNYPDLPQYAMFWLGKTILALGYSDTEILIASRVLSALLAGSTIIIVYVITRQAGGNIYLAGLSGLFLLCISDLSNNGRFAHNDTYALFFSTLSMLFLLEYVRKDHRGWLYASFITVGMAASSKYNAGSLVLTPLATFLILQRGKLRKDLFSIAETLFISGALTFLGFAVGTPKALTWMAYYFKRVYAALSWQVSWGQRDDSVRGIIGQFRLMNNILSIAMFLLFMAGLVWSASRIIQAYRNGTLNRTSRESTFAVLLLGILALDLPVMVSYNYQPRYLLPFMPMLAILSVFFVEYLYSSAKRPIYKKLLSIFVGGTILFSFARLISVTLLFVNDSRIPASRFMLTLLPGTSLEHTSYPPSYPDGYFEREHNYPMYIQMGTIDTVSENQKINRGEAGLLDRGTDYLIVDSFTAGRFDDPYACNQVPVECEFFKQLEMGGSEHYRLIAEFKYTLPWYLPTVHPTFANPTIRIYERIQ